jgi:putative Mg2+ transporter-C (MgtC) family protein
VASLVVSGVGFLGAGVIFKDGAIVHGLNTAATVWCSAAIGVLAGLRSLHLASILASTVLLANLALPPLVNRFHRAVPADSAESRYEILITCPSVDEMRLRALLVTAIGRTSATLLAIYREDNRATGCAQLRTEVSTPGRQNELIEQIAVHLTIEPSVTSLSWSVAPAAIK